MSENNHHQTGNNPILIVLNRSESREFGGYTGEILIAEGFNAFQIEWIDAIDLDRLNNFNIVILTQTRLNAVQTDIFRAYVSNGGRLIAFRPDQQLADVFGICKAESIIEEGYICVDLDTNIGKGISPETMQFHGKADGYLLNGAELIATLFSDSTTKTSFPAITSHLFGKGQAVAFTYNLPKSIVYTRQSNPTYASQERDGIPGIRAAEMYLGYTDASKNHLNQADEHMRLLSHSIEVLTKNYKPLPRIWYFPGYQKCLVTLTDDGEDSNLEDFQVHLADIESKGARITLYLKNPSLPISVVTDWATRGHEIACHFDDTAEAVMPTYAGMNSVATETVKAHLQAYGFPPRTVRNHWIVWVGWTEQAAIEAGLGIGLDCNLYHYDQGSSHGHYLGNAGNFTGSGLPMKFVDRSGQIIDIYQSLTQLPDEQWLEENFYGCFKTLIDRSLDSEAFTFVNVNFHTDRWQIWSRKPGLDMLDYANRRNVPVWTAEHVLDFLRAREAASIHDIRWCDHKLSFTFEIPIGGQDLTLMLPHIHNGLTISRVEADGVRQTTRRMTIKGRIYTMLKTGAGGSFDYSVDYR
jgi:hypothetical protein